jgi:cell division protein FtsA
VRKRIEDTGMLEQLSAGAVLTGGAVLLEGMSEFAEEILGMPVRIGYPVGIKGITQLVQGPQFATGVGLVKFGAQSLAHAREVGVAHTRLTVQRHRAEAEPQIAAPPKKAKFLQWLKAAF